MATLTVKSVFKLTGLNKKDIKSSKSATEKTIISRAKKELPNMTDNLDWNLKKVGGEACLNSGAYIPVYLRDEIYYLKEKVNLLTRQANGDVADEDWVLWFAFDCQAFKVFGADAKRLFELLSDGKDHDIEGSLETVGNAFEVIDWKEI